MNKKLLLIALALALVLSILPGCTRNGSSEPGTTTPKGNFKIVRKSALGTKWQMYQFELTLPANGDFDLDFLDLADSDQVDGYFYPETGTGVSLNILAGASSIFTSAPAPGTNNSDRFSFKATLPKGTFY